MTPDQLLNRMLSFANSVECANDRKKEVVNAAWRTWAFSIERQLYKYDDVKNERIRYIDGVPIVNTLKTYGVYKKKKMTALEWIQRRKDNQYQRQLKNKSNEKENQ